MGRYLHHGGPDRTRNYLQVMMTVIPWEEPSYRPPLELSPCSG